MTLIKSISGIRGTIGGAVGDNLTPVDIVRFTTAFVRLLSPDGQRIKIVVGRDARLSGPMVEQLVVGTLLGCGADVVELGLCTTPGVEMAVPFHRADGGIIITASHNPRQWNALKLLDASGEFISAADGARLLELVAADDVVFPSVDGLGRIIASQSFDDEHIKAVLSLPLVEVARVRSRRFKVVVDAVNSVGGIVVPKLLQALGVQVIELNCEPTGEFAHNPEPLPENLTEIAARVVAEKADLGIVVDPDVDRLALVCEDGTMFGEEYTLVAAADYVLSQTPGNTVSNLSSSRALSDITQRYGGQYFASAVGEVNVVDKMKEVGAVIGGEGNGGVIYPTLHYGRDALVGIALILTHLARTGMSASALRASYPDYVMSKNKIELTPEVDVDGLLRQIAMKYAGDQVNTVDGLKIDLAEGWVHLRRSNTEPIVRIYSESRDETAARALAEKVISDIKSLI